MKKLFAFILVLTSLSVGCLFPNIGAFAMSNVDSSMHEGMNHDMQSDIWMHSVPEDDWENIHECCESPFIDTESLVSNNIQKLNSPPKRWLLFNDSLKNTYVSLTGIVKNNS